LLDPDRYLERLYENTRKKYSFNRYNEWASWREDLKEAFIEKLGGFPEEKTELSARLIDETSLEDHIRQKIVILTDVDLEMNSYILIPKKGCRPFPAVVACHGHGCYGGIDLIGLDPGGIQKTGDPGYQDDFALKLVKRGFLVIVPDILGFGERRLKEDENEDPGKSSCHHMATYMLMLGKTLAGARVYDIIRAIDYLCTRDEVDPGRIGCMGISGGGMVCGFTSAIDERIKAAVVSGYTNIFKHSIMSVFHCVCNFVPGLLEISEMPDILGMIAPRALLIQSGTKDPIFPINGTLHAYDKIRDIYMQLGEEEKIGKDIFEAGHCVYGENAYSWFEKWL